MIVFNKSIDHIIYLQLCRKFKYKHTAAAGAALNVSPRKHEPALFSSALTAPQPSKLTLSLRNNLIKRIYEIKSRLKYVRSKETWLKIHLTHSIKQLWVCSQSHCSYCWKSQVFAVCEGSGVHKAGHSDPTAWLEEGGRESWFFRSHHVDFDQLKQRDSHRTEPSADPEQTAK